MKALIVSKAFVNRLYRRKLEELHALGIEVVAVAPPAWHEGGAVQELEEANGSYALRVLPVRLNGHFHLHFYSGLPHLIREIQPDIVHMDEEPYNLATFLGLLSARRANAAGIFFTWQNVMLRYPPPFSDLERAVYRWSSLAIAGNEDATKVLHEKGFSRRVVVIPQFGVDADLFFPSSRPRRPFTVGFLNRLVPGKAPLLALQAFATLPHSARMIIAGDGPLRGEVETKIQSLELSARVEIRPRLPSTDMPALMRALDVVILPSVTLPKWKEQFGRVLIEAMSSGVPVIGSTSGEIPHVIGAGGLIVQENDRHALAEAMCRLMDDRKMRKELGERGRKRVLDHFTHRRIAEATAEAYQQALRTGN